MTHKTTRLAHRAGHVRKFKWFVKTSWQKLRQWKRSKCSEQRELDAFRKCVQLERKLVDYPESVPLLTELMGFYRITGQIERCYDVMRRLRDITPRPVPDFMWDDLPSARLVRINNEAWCARIEQFVKEKQMDSIHLQHVKQLLLGSHCNPETICRVLEERGVFGAFDRKICGYPVLVDPAEYDRNDLLRELRKAK